MIGTCEKNSAFPSGSSAQSSASSFQFSVPNAAKNAVESTITATQPQQ